MLVMLTATFVIDPAISNRIWRGTEGMVREYALVTGFLLF
jgi:adenylate cyclase